MGWRRICHQSRLHDDESGKMESVLPSPSRDDGLGFLVVVSFALFALRSPVLAAGGHLLTLEGGSLWLRRRRQQRKRRLLPKGRLLPRRRLLRRRRPPRRRP